jgi:drug/metabolite transporter (DMT)-like permease
MNYWIVVAVVTHIVASGLTSIGNKHLTNTLPQAKALTVQFAWATLFALGLSLNANSFSQQVLVPAVMIVGGINSLGAYFQWRALWYSLSTTYLFAPLSPLWASLLAALFLDEAPFYRQAAFLGSVSLLYAATILMIWPKKREFQSEKTGKQLGWQWLIFTLATVLIFGSNRFLNKYFSLTLPHSTFLLSWYSGSLLGMALLAFILREPGSLRWRDTIRIAPVSAGIFITLGTLYWSFKLAPIAVVLPVLTFGTTLIPLLAGWFIFHERQGLSRLQWTGFAAGIIGTLALSIHQLR